MIDIHQEIEQLNDIWNGQTTYGTRYEWYDHVEAQIKILVEWSEEVDRV